jgi:IPT/TIG domain
MASEPVRTSGDTAAKGRLPKTRGKLFRTLPATVLALSIAAALTPALAPSASAATANRSTSQVSAIPDCRGCSPAEVLSVSPDSGPTSGGTIVTITYAELTGSPAVAARFGGVEATTLSGVPGEITVAAPAHAAGVVQIQLILASGNASLGDVPEDEYTYVTAG